MEKGVNRLAERRHGRRRKTAGEERSVDDSSGEGGANEGNEVGEGTVGGDEVISRATARAAEAKKRDGEGEAEGKEGVRGPDLMGAGLVGAGRAAATTAYGRMGRDNDGRGAALPTTGRGPSRGRRGGQRRLA